MSSYTDAAPKTYKKDYDDVLFLDATGHSVKEIAEKTGYSSDNIYLIKQNETYKAKLAKLREQIDSEVIQQGVARLNVLVHEAVQVLEDTLRDPHTSRSNKLKAAAEVLNRVPATSISLREYAPKQERPAVLFDPEALLRHLTITQALPEMDEYAQELIRMVKQSVTDAAIEQEVQRRLGERLGLLALPEGDDEEREHHND